MQNLILGSTSPRRKKILNYFSIKFRQISPQFDENNIVFTGDPAEYAAKISQGKAANIAKDFPNDPIITADTIVYKGSDIFLKPKNKEQAIYMLTELSGSKHYVYTSVTIRKRGEEFTDTEITELQFNHLSKEQIQKIIIKNQWKDKAGAYAIQNSGCLLIKKINGCYYNVLGMPINLVESLLNQVDISLWDSFT